MSLSKVNSALQKAYVDGEFFENKNIAFENVSLEPGSVPYCALNFVPGEPFVATLGSKGTDRYDGFLQVTLNYPLNTGTKAIADKADAIRNAFTAGQRFSYSGQEVIIKSCGRSQGRITEGVFKMFVSIYFYAYIQRPI